MNLIDSDKLNYHSHITPPAHPQLPIQILDRDLHGVLFIAPYIQRNTYSVHVVDSSKTYSVHVVVTRSSNTYMTHVVDKTEHRALATSNEFTVQHFIQ